MSNGPRRQASSTKPKASDTQNQKQQLSEKTSLKLRHQGKVYIVYCILYMVHIRRDQGFMIHNQKQMHP